MAELKITNFLGIAPKISPELLPDTAAQVARNCKLYSGSLIPYPQPVLAGNTSRNGVIKTLYALRNPDNPSELKWLSWTTDVDIAVAASTDDKEQRFYYTGDGVPKVSNYRLATSGNPPYPIDYYELGLPIPEDSQKLTATAPPYTPKTIVGFSRDASNIVTITTSEPHKLRTGNYITVSGFSFLVGSYTQQKIERTGSYSQASASSSMLITITDHNLTNGQNVQLEFSSHTDLNGAYTVAVLDKNTFAIVAPNASARSGTVTWKNGGASSITVEIPGHGLSNGAQVYLDFVSGLATDGLYTISNVTPNSFQISASGGTTITGMVRLDMRSFNAISVPCTVIDDTKLSYFSPGPAVAYSTSVSEAKVELGGSTQTRSYVFTWYTPWKEESIASKPSDNLYIKDGLTVTVSNIPTTKPPGKNFIRGVRLYRTLPSASGTEYFRLATLWFPTPLVSVSRTSGVARVKTQYPHNLDEGDRFKIGGCSVNSFNVADLKVTNVVDDYTFEFAQSGGDVSETSASGTLYCDVAETSDKPARYWGDGGNYNFIDDFDSRALLRSLDTDNYDKPPEDLRGLVVLPNNILAGFVGNTLYFSEPDRPHAWPSEYETVLENNIVATVVVSGSLLVLTDRYPYIVSVTDPASGVSVSRVDAELPCLSAKSVVTTGSGVIYSTYDGLAIYSPATGPALVTKALYNNDTWETSLDPKSIVATSYEGLYFASHSNGAFVFERDDKIGGFFVDCDFQFTAAWFDSVSGRLYCANGANGGVYWWDNLSQPPMTQRWKSKLIVIKDPVNFGAARIIADYNGSPVTFRMWVDKELIFETTITDSRVFRLPTGYRSDTFEFEVVGTARVYAIYLAETPYGLKAV